MRSSLALSLVFGAGAACGATGCDQILGIDSLHGPGDGGTGSQGGDGRNIDANTGPAAECTAQRVVEIVGGTGSLAWFTLVWPVPEVITQYQPAYAYDNPNLALNASTDPNHPLFSRNINGGALWAGVGESPQPTAFIAGTNETHTVEPSSIVASGANELVASAAVLQSTLSPVFPVVAFSPQGAYGNATGAPSLVVVSDVPGAIALFNGTSVSMATQMELEPTSAQLASYLPSSPTSGETVLATKLAFTANAFRLGLITSVIMQGYDDDPHGAFDSGAASTRANNLAGILDAFYRDLAKADETTCGHDHQRLSLADNTVLVVIGDTFKNPYESAGWPDGTPGNSNLMYVRGNGFLKPGWFGNLPVDGSRVNFNPTTGLASSGASIPESTLAAVGGTLYAIARGDAQSVSVFTNQQYGGTIFVP